MNISIIIPTFNRPKHLERLLKSILSQTYLDYEVIVVNDASQNLSEYEMVINKYKPLFNEFRYFINDKNRGAPFSRNKGIDVSKYDLIAFVDDDDLWLENKIKDQIDLFLESKGEVDLIYCWVDAIDQDDRIKHQYRSEIEGNPKKEILTECFIPSPSVIVKKEFIVKAGMFDENLPSCQDWDLWVRIIFAGARCKGVRQVNAKYCVHQDTSIGKSGKAALGYVMFYKKHLLKTLMVNRAMFIKYILRIVKYYIFRTI